VQPWKRNPLVELVAGRMLLSCTSLMVLIAAMFTFCPKPSNHVLAQSRNLNSVSDEPGELNYVTCGTIVNNTNVLVKNPHHPEPTYTKTICETVIERADSSINKLNVIFKQLELYRPTIDGQCLQDRFAVYTDLNAVVTPVICGNHTGETISLPFLPPQTSLIISITTSDLDHDRLWVVEVGQE